MQHGVETPHHCFRTRIEKSKKENKARVKLTDSLLFLDFVHHLIFSRSTAFQKPAPVPFSGKEPAGPLV